LESPDHTLIPNIQSFDSFNTRAKYSLTVLTEQNYKFQYNDQHSIIQLTSAGKTFTFPDGTLETHPITASAGCTKNTNVIVQWNQTTFDQILHVIIRADLPVTMNIPVQIRKLRKRLQTFSGII
jgi:hypothetical protein